MSKFKHSLLAGAIMLAVSAPAAAQFTGAFFFGDSLSDEGSYKPVLPPGTGLFTTNPGPLWPSLVANVYGFNATPANQGGNDYAYGGARVTEPPLPGTSPPVGSAVPISTQVSQFLAKGAPDPNALYSIQGGANDIISQVGLLQAGLINTSQLQANVVLAATQFVQQVARLNAAGAQYILVSNIQDGAVTPDGLASGLGPQITQITQLYNSTMLAGLNAANLHVIRLNMFGLYNEVTASPGAYGFTNATGRACTTSSSLICTPATLVTPTAPQSYVFADGVHPTTGMGAIVAQYTESVLAAPQQVAVLAETPLDVEQANWRALDGRMASAINATRPTNKIEGWAAYDYANPDYSSGFYSGNANLNTVSIGGDMKLSDRLLFGLQFGYTQDKGNLGAADYKLNDYMGTMYLGYGEDNWYVGATLGAGGLDYSNISRTVQLGALTRTETGSANGYQTVARVLGGYWFRYDNNWVHGPWVKVTYDDVVVHSFQENGSASTTMGFDQQERKQLLTSLGWQVSGNVNGIRPFGRVSWEYDSKADERSVSAGVVGMGGSFSLPAYKPDNSWALFNFGASTDVGKIAVSLYGAASAGKSDGDYWAVTLGIRAPL
jgi:outer membrane lipase/esterase